jgi:hypothetical protein
MSPHADRASGVPVPLTCCLQASGAAQVAELLPSWPSLGQYLAIRVRLARRLHFWLHGPLLRRLRLDAL